MRDHNGAHSSRCGNGRSTERRIKRTGQDGYRGQTAGFVPYKFTAHIQQIGGHLTAVHDFSGKEKEGDRHKRKRIHQCIHPLRQDSQIHAAQIQSGKRCHANGYGYGNG